MSVDGQRWNIWILRGIEYLIVVSAWSLVLPAALLPHALVTGIGSFTGIAARELTLLDGVEIRRVVAVPVV